MIQMPLRRVLDPDSQVPQLIHCLYPFQDSTNLLNFNFSYYGFLSVLKQKKVGGNTRPFRCDLDQIPCDYTVEVTNRFKGLDLIGRVPEQVWMEIHDIVQEVVIKTIPKGKKKCKKAKWLSEEGLKIAEKKREVQNKGEMERYSSECRVPKNSKERQESLPK